MLAPLAVFAAVVVSLSSAQAIYIATPLQLALSAPRADVGDELGLRLAPRDDDARRAWAGRTIEIRWRFYEAPSDDPETPVSSNDYRSGSLGTVALDDWASGAFSFRVPAAIDGKNVEIVATAGDELLGFARLAVGDAEEMYYLLAGGDDDGRERAGNEQQRTSNDAAKPAKTPGLDALAVAGAVGLAGAGAVLLARRK